MRQINSELVTEAVAQMVIRANYKLPEDVRQALKKSSEKEESATAKEILRQLEENCILAEKSGIPLCQDTGLAVFFVEIGREVYISGQNIKEAIEEGVRKGYKSGFLRKSVCHPLTRVNSGDNTPAIIHLDIVEGDKLKISFMAKGGGSENMSAIALLPPAEGWPGIKRFVINKIAKAGANSCPPLIVGLGIGGNFEMAPLLAKKALLRDLNDRHPDPEVGAMEEEILDALNKLKIGPMGLGGKTTALAVKIALTPCHIASLPVALNTQCHSARHDEMVL